MEVEKESRRPPFERTTELGLNVVRQPFSVVVVERDNESIGYKTS